MTQPGGLIALEPFASSPRRLALAAVAIIAAVLAIQTASGVPPWVDFAPIELSSNVVAAMGLVWAGLKLRADRPNAASRLAWIAAAAGTALLSADGYLGELMLDPFDERREMNVSIVVWLCAAGLLLFAGRRLGSKPYAMLALGAGVGLQFLAQYAGWLAVSGGSVRADLPLLEYLNDLGELASSLAYVAGLLLAGFAPGDAADGVAALTASAAARPLPQTAGSFRPAGKIVSLAEFRRAVVRCAELGVTFPQVYRIRGFSWRDGADGRPERVPSVSFGFTEDDLTGVEEAEAGPVAAPDPDVDAGWIIVRHHRSQEALNGYLDAIADFGPTGGRIQTAETADGYFTVALRPAPPGGCDSLLVYAARAMRDTDGLETDWTYAVGPDGREATLPRRKTAGAEIWVD